MPQHSQSRNSSVFSPKRTSSADHHEPNSRNTSPWSRHRSPNLLPCMPVTPTRRSPQIEFPKNSRTSLEKSELCDDFSFVKSDKKSTMSESRSVKRTHVKINRVLLKILILTAIIS